MTRDGIVGHEIFCDGLRDSDRASIGLVVLGDFCLERRSGFGRSLAGGGDAGAQRHFTRTHLRVSEIELRAILLGRAAGDAFELDQ